MESSRCESTRDTHEQKVNGHLLSCCRPRRSTPFYSLVPSVLTPTFRPTFRRVRLPNPLRTFIRASSRCSARDTCPRCPSSSARRSSASSLSTGSVRQAERASWRPKSVSFFRTRPFTVAKRGKTKNLIVRYGFLETYFPDAARGFWGLTFGVCLVADDSVLVFWSWASFVIFRFFFSSVTLFPWRYYCCCCEGSLEKPHREKGGGGRGWG